MLRGSMNNAAMQKMQVGFASPAFVTSGARAHLWVNGNIRPQENIMADRIHTALSVLSQRIRLHATRKALYNLDERALSDIGFSRADVALRLG